MALERTVVEIEIFNRGASSSSKVHTHTPLSSHSRWFHEMLLFWGCYNVFLEKLSLYLFFLHCHCSAYPVVPLGFIFTRGGGGDEEEDDEGG